MKNRIFFTFVFLMTAVFCVHAQYDPESDFIFTINSDGSSITITEYSGTKQQINIPPIIQGLPVTVIGDRAFESKRLARVVIPSRVTYIGIGAFANNSLMSVNLPNSVIFIGLGAFANNQLTSVTIPGSVITIEDSVFRQNQLTSVTIPNSVTSIGEVAFANNRLTSIAIPNSVTSIGSYAFANNQLTRINISNNVTFIGNSAFANNRLTSVTVGGNINITNTGLPSNLISIYNNSGRKAGTYVLQGASWSMGNTGAVSDALNQINPALRFNTIGGALGYQGVSAFGFTVSGTVSPADYTFFDFSLGLGFNYFSFNTRINFNAFVPFSFGGWYAGIGIGAGYNQLSGGYFAGNLTTGFILFNWLNIAYILQFGTFSGITNNNITIGYTYRLNNVNKKEPLVIGRASPVSAGNLPASAGNTGNSAVNTQDLIILKNGSTIEAKVLEISPTEIRYKRFDNLEGPTIVIMAADVLSIRYANGRMEIINSVQ